MPYIKFIIKNNRYYHLDSDTVEMCILGNFLSSDVGCSNIESFRQFALNDWEEGTSSNATHLEKENGDILLSDIYPMEEFASIELRVSKEQYLKLLDSWQNICKIKPKEVFIKYEDHQFIIEIKN